MIWRFAGILFAFTYGYALFGQTPPDRADWVSALAERFNRHENPVTAIYAKARLAALVCPQNQSVGVKLFREAFAQLRSLPEDAFDHSDTTLPISTLKALSNTVVPAARSCDERDQWSEYYDRPLEQRIYKEWHEKGNLWLRTALDTADPDRTDQLARAALSLGWIGSSMLPYDKRTPDIALFDRVLRRLTLTDPHLADDLFEKATNWPTSHDAGAPAELELMGRYLFPTESSIPLDPYPGFEDAAGAIANPPRIPNFMHAQLKGSLDVASRFLASTVRMLENFHPISADPAGSYSLAYQMLPKARQYAPQHVDAIENALRNLETIPKTQADGIRKKLGAPPIEPNRLNPTSEILSDIRNDRLASAHRKLGSIGDNAVREQIEALISFREIAITIDTANKNRIAERPIYPEPGVKRVLLNASIAAMDGDRDVASQALRLALKDTETLPPSQQICLLPALASLANKSDIPGILQRWVNAYNENFDRLRAKVSDPNPIRCGAGGPEELVKTPVGLQRVTLSVQRIATHKMTDFLAKTSPADHPTLEPLIVELHDETERTQSLLVLAKVRLTTP